MLLFCQKFIPFTAGIKLLKREEMEGNTAALDDGRNHRESSVGAAIGPHFYGSNSGSAFPTITVVSWFMML